jgi:hypothetical protein
MAQVLEYLPSKCEALSSNSSSVGKKSYKHLLNNSQRFIVYLCSYFSHFIILQMKNLGHKRRRNLLRHTSREWQGQALNPPVLMVSLAA